jgi:hypothetical protein
MAKKTNAYTKRGLIQTRVSTEDLREIITKSVLYAKGNVSEYIRMAALNYRPTRKVAK